MILYEHGHNNCGCDINSWFNDPRFKNEVISEQKFSFIRV